MGTTPEPGQALCPTCRAPLDADGACPACSPPGGGTDGTLEEAPPAAPVFGDFEVTRRPDGSLWELGRGAMGVTYRALDRVLHRHVALKVIKPSGGPDGARLIKERFLREARAAASLRHTNVADIFQFGVNSEAGSCFYAMELVEGETLEARVRRDGPLAVGTALEIASQVAAALVAASAKGLIHRDLKPSNLMLSTAELEVKVVDFGLAKAVSTSPTEADLTRGGFVGTPAYASPEQFDHGSVDARADLYSLGVTLWYMLTGRALFAGRTLDELRDHPARTDLPIEQLTTRRVPAPVVGLLRAVLAVDPARRPGSARELLDALENCRRQLGLGRPGRPTLPDEARSDGRARRFAVPVLVACAVLLLLAALGVWWWQARGANRGADPGPGNLEKSIAVLPFENLGDAENAFFTAGIQDEILTDLSKVADLKVISRTSVMAYVPGHAGNVLEIGRALGVTHLLEGRVQRAAGHVRVSATLVDASKNGQVIWAEHYDNDLADIFRIQSEIAERIAASLRAKLSSAEKAAIDTRPTADLAAYDLYLRAKELVATYGQTADWRATLLQAVRLLDEAIARDGNFALAYCVATKAHSDLYFTNLDHTPARRALLERCANAALRLQPDLGEAHLAHALWLYRGEQNYPEARRELATAQAALPNNTEVLLLLAYLDRREGRWADARANQERATILDPTNFDLVTEKLVLYDRMRLYREFIQTADAAVAAIPRYADYFRLLKAELLMEAGQVRAARLVLDALPADYDPNGTTTYTRVCAALYDGRPDEAAATVAAFHREEYPGANGEMTPRVWLEIAIAQAKGDREPARNALAQARDLAAASVAQHPEDAAALALLGLADAGLGHKDDALREGRRAVEMRPVSADAMDGPAVLGTLALIDAWVDEPGAAMDLLTTLQSICGGPDYGQLRYDPMWSALRGRQDFQAMLAQMEPRLGP